MARKGARRMSDVPREVLTVLAAGDAETVNLMEWLAADMSALASAVARSCEHPGLKATLLKAAEDAVGLGVIRRLHTYGRAIAAAVPDPNTAEFQALSGHRSDLVRQWACYAVNDPITVRTPQERLELTLPFAADRNMSVREAAWMAFRPYVAMNLAPALGWLAELSRSPDANIRRFCVEVTRPRSVWGVHIPQLKASPELALPILTNVRKDPSRYVQLAVGNWLNDASKTRGDWVAETCRRWRKSGNAQTAFIIKRGMRSLNRRGATRAASGFEKHTVRRQGIEGDRLC